jgi:hypothetical protein
MNPINSRSVPITTGQVHATAGRVPGTIDRVPAIVGMMSEEIAAKYHTCLMLYRAKPGTLDMSHRWSAHVRSSETLTIYHRDVELHITFVTIYIF